MKLINRDIIIHVTNDMMAFMKYMHTTTNDKEEQIHIYHVKFEDGTKLFTNVQIPEKATQSLIKEKLKTAYKFRASQFALAA